MPFTCVAPLSNCNYPFIPISHHHFSFSSFFHLHRPHPPPPHLPPLKLTPFSHSKNLSPLTLHLTYNCNHRPKDLDPGNHPRTRENTQGYSDPDRDSSFSGQFQCSIDVNDEIEGYLEGRKGARGREIDEKRQTRIGNQRGIFTNMWWADVKAALGQRINIEGVVSFVGVFVRDRHLALPHVVVPDVRYIDWGELRRRGFKGVVFDKDNTITVPYSLTLWGPLGPSLEECKSVFGNDIAVFSNSAGLYEYDHDGSKARMLEKAIGIRVIRHRVKKPAGTAEEIEKHFGCKSSQLIMVGDRPFTDVVYGNRNSFLTILTEPLSLAEEPLIVRQVRKLEAAFTKYWLRNGLKPISHSLLPDATQCIRDPQSL